MYTEIDEYQDWFYAKFNKPHMPQWCVYREDHATLLRLIKKYNIKSILEIGTWSGWTGLLLYLFPGVERLHSIDINAQMPGIDYNVPNHILMPKHFYGHYLRDTHATIEFCDSTKRQQREGENYDLVFIDGNHLYEYVKSDTELALKMKPKVIAWHDYGSEPGVNQYLNEIGNFIRYDNSLVAYRILVREEFGK